MPSYPKPEQRDLPPPPHWTKAIGVGVVVMGLAIGTGELIMWPHLITKYGIQLIWLAALGIGAQYFINQEVARLSIARGESFFTSSARLFPPLVFFWFFAAILLYIWPGWASAIGTTLQELTGFGTYIGWAIVTLLLVLVLTYTGKVAYLVLERTLKITVPLFFFLLVVISFFNLKLSHFQEAFAGLLTFHIPEGIDMNILLSAIVFAGAGGMLNLCVSLWYRDKQVGMGAYVGRITNPITGKTEAVSTSSYVFPTTKENMKRWKGWMKFIRIDQGLIFTLLGFITLFLLGLNAHAVLTPKGLVPDGVEVAVVQANIFGEQWGPIGFNLFLVMAFLMLFSVMWTVIDALTRILTDILYTNSHTGPYVKFFKFCKNCSTGKLYYIIITALCITGAFLLPMKQPLVLLTISAVLGGLTMAVYTPMLILLTNTQLPKPIRPSWFTNIVMVLISLFFIFFSVRVIQQNLF
jgi:hypothetical protein